MIYRKLIVLASLLIGFVNIAFAGVGDLDTLNVRSQAPVKERMPVVAYKFNPKSLTGVQTCALPICQGENACRRL